MKRGEEYYIEKFESWQQARQMTKQIYSARREDAEERATRVWSHSLHGIAQVEAREFPFFSFAAPLCRMNPVSTVRVPFSK